MIIGMPGGNRMEPQAMLFPPTGSGREDNDRGLNSPGVLGWIAAGGPFKPSVGLSGAVLHATAATAPGITPRTLDVWELRTEWSRRADLNCRPLAETRAILGTLREEFHSTGPYVVETRHDF